MNATKNDEVRGFRGWAIVAVAFAAQALSIGLSIIPYGLFIQPIIVEFDASVMIANGGIAVLFFVMTIAGTIVGPLVDRHSIRAIMVGGAIVMSASFALMSITSSLLQLGMLFGVGVAIGVAMLGPLPASAVVVKWFDRKRGRALGIAAIGPFAGGLALTPLVGALIESVGWRVSLQCFSVGVLGIVPFIWIVIRNRPEDVGQLPDGEPARDVEGDAVVPNGGEIWTTRQILTARNFWALALGVGIVFGLGSGWNANAPKYAADLGYSIEEAGYLLAVAAGIGIPGTLLFGALADRADGRRLLWIAITAQALAFGALWSEPSYIGLIGTMAVFGFFAGALMPVYASLIGKFFGPLSFGNVMGLAGLVMMPFGALAPPLAGYLRDSNGDYASTLQLFIAGMAISAVCLGFLRTRPRSAV